MFNGADCYTKRDAGACEESAASSVWFNGTCYNSSQLADFNDYAACTSTTSTPSYNCTPVNWLQQQIDRKTSAAEEYFKYALPSF